MTPTQVAIRFIEAKHSGNAKEALRYSAKETGQLKIFAFPMPYLEGRPCDSWEVISEEIYGGTTWRDGRRVKFQDKKNEFAEVKVLFKEQIVGPIYGRKFVEPNYKANQTVIIKLLKERSGWGVYDSVPEKW